MTSEHDYSNPDEAFADLFKAQRAQSGLSQEDVAKAMTGQGYDFHQQTIYKIESGKRRVSVGEAIALAAAIKVHVNTLMWQPAEEESFSLAEELRDEVAHLVDEVDHIGSRLEGLTRSTSRITGLLSQMEPDDGAVITLPGGRTVSITEGARRLLAPEGIPRLISAHDALDKAVGSDLRATAHIHDQL